MGSLVQTATNYEAGSDNNVATAYGSNVAANNLLVAVVGSYHDSVTISSVADTRSTTYTQAGTLLRQTANSPATMLAIYYGIAPSGGANTITVTYSGALAQKSLTIYEVSGVNTTTPLHLTNGGTGTATTALSGNITTTTAGFIILGLQEWAWTGAYNPNASTPTTGWTEVGENAQGHDTAWQNFTTTGTRQGGFTGVTNDGWCCRIVAFADAAAGGGGIARKLAGVGGGMAFRGGLAGRGGGRAG